jgi:hypothetical protein
VNFLVFFFFVFPHNLIIGKITTTMWFIIVPKVYEESLNYTNFN